MESSVGFGARLRRWAGNVLAVGLGLLAVVLLVAAAEGVLRLKSRLTTPPDKVSVVGRLTGAIGHESILGAEGKPNGVIQCVAARGDRILYNTSCRTDAAGRRLTPCDCPDEDASVALFFGCSITFGLGVEDGETLPARYCARTPGFKSLNFGLSGYGPQQMWLQICRQGVLREFRPRKGILVYTFIDDHVNRLAGTPAVVSEWAYPLPWLDLRDGRVEWRGSFYDRDPLRYLYLRYVDRMHLARFVQSRLSPRPESPTPSDSALDLLAGVLRECAKTAETECPDFRCYCLIFPKFASQWGKALADRLDEAGVQVLDYRALLEGAPLPDTELFFDDNSLYRLGHPKAPAYDLIAAQLSRDLGGTAAKAAQP